MPCHHQVIVLLHVQSQIFSDHKSINILYLSKIELCNKIKEQISNFQILESDIGKDPDKRDYIVSNKKIESTGWQPRYSLEDGISELIKAYSYLTTNRFNNV